MGNSGDGRPRGGGGRHHHRGKVGAEKKIIGKDIIHIYENSTHPSNRNITVIRMSGKFYYQ
jgi:hypothetical protein